MEDLSRDLFEAAEKGAVELFQQSLGGAEQFSAARRLRNEDGRSLLHVASASGHARIVSLLADGADPAETGVNACDEEGWTPLISAVSSGRGAAVEALLRAGADVSIRNQGGRTALHYAASKGRSKIAQILILHGAKINVKDKVGCTPLHRAASAGHADVCEVLLEEGANIDATDATGQTPLMHAVICDNQQVALLLVRHGADVDAQDKEEYTVLGRATDQFRPVLIDAAKAMLEG